MQSTHFHLFFVSFKLSVAVQGIIFWYAYFLLNRYPDVSGQKSVPLHNLTHTGTSPNICMIRTYIHTLGIFVEGTIVSASVGVGIPYGGATTT